MFEVKGRPDCCKPLKVCGPAPAFVLMLPCDGFGGRWKWNSGICRDQLVLGLGLSAGWGKIFSGNPYVKFRIAVLYRLDNQILNPP